MRYGSCELRVARLAYTILVSVMRAEQRRKLAEDIRDLGKGYVPQWLWLAAHCIQKVTHIEIGQRIILFESI